VHYMILAAEAASSSGINTAETIFAILASAIVVIGGISALVRIIWKTANLLRDTADTTKITAEHLDKLTLRVDELERRVK